jgi:general secretion pathway protein G
MTIVELLIVCTIIITLAAVAIPVYARMVQQARITRAVGDIRVIEAQINAFRINYLRFPDTLADLGGPIPRDPWGNPYQYLNYANVKGKGPLRKDRFLVPLNTNYDLYSMGPDGQSQPPLTAKVSKDDIVRANDGGFVGVASDY